RMRSIRTKTSRHKTSFFPAAGLINKARDPHLTWTLIPPLSLCYINTHYIAHCSFTLHSCFAFCTLLSTLLFLHSLFIYLYRIYCVFGFLCVVLICVFMLCVVLIVFLCFYVLCLLYAPSHQKKFQVSVNLLGNKSHSDSDSDSDSDL